MPTMWIPVNMWTTFTLTATRFRTHYVRGMGTVHEADLFSAAGHLSNAADNLRAIGLLSLADEIDSFIAMLDAEILLATLAPDSGIPG